MQLSESPVRVGCPSAAELRAFDQGYLPDPDIDRVSAHLECCPDCSAVLDRFATGDPFAAELRTATADALPHEPGTAGRYREVALIGQGAMGVVFRAVEEPTGRTVALKRLIGHLALTPLAIARFRLEVSSLARVEHPHVVRLYDFDLDADPAYLVMEFVDGEPLGRQLNCKPLVPREAAALVEKVAGAVQAIHDAGLLHRDLKPGNILMTRAGEPKVSDFGLARSAADDDSRLTKTGASVGTPAYMPPEQARGDTAHLTPAADVYSLGATLYECLTGRPPFVGPNELSVLEQVISREPLSPTRLQPKVPRDLATIALKCLEKDPWKRYATAGEVAAELGRFREGKPILARPIGLHRRAYRKVMRRKLVSALVAAIVLAVVGGGAYSTFRLIGERRANREAGIRTYDLAIRDADTEWREGRADKSLIRLNDCPVDLRSWEWHLLTRRCMPERLIPVKNRHVVGSIRVTSDGKRARVFSNDWDVRTVDLATGEQLGPPVSFHDPCQSEFHPNGRLVAIHRPGRITLWDIDSRQVIQTLPGPLEHGPILAISPDGCYLAVGDVHRPDVLVYEIATGDAVRHWQAGVENDHRPGGGKRVGVYSLAFSPDGRRLAAGARDRVTIWNVETGDWDWSVPAYVDSDPVELHAVQHVAFAGPAGRQLIVAGRLDPRVPQRAELIVYDLDHKRPTRVLADDQTDYDAISVTPDGRRFAYLRDHRVVIVRDVESGRELVRVRPMGPIGPVAFTRDGRRLLIGTGERIEVWDAHQVAGGDTIQATPADRAYGLAVTRDGSTAFFTAAGDPATPQDKRVCITDRRSGTQDYLSLGTTFKDLSPSDMALSPNEELLAIGMPGAGGVQVWDWRRRERKPLLTVPPGTNGVNWLDWASDQQIVAIATTSSIWTWDLSGSSVGRLLYTSPVSLNGFALTPDRRQAVFGEEVADAAGKLLVLDLQTETVAPCPSENARFCSFGFSPDGRRLAASTLNPFTVRVLDWPSGALLAQAVETHERPAKFTLFTPDGRRVITGSHDGKVKVWDASRGTEMLHLRGHTAAVNRGVILTNGLLFTSSWDATVRVWDGRPID